MTSFLYLTRYSCTASRHASLSTPKAAYLGLRPPPCVVPGMQTYLWRSYLQHVKHFLISGTDSLGSVIYFNISLTYSSSLPASRTRAHSCPTARPTGPGHLGFPASPAPLIASPPARTGAAIRVLYRILEMFSTRLNPPQHQIPPLQLGLFLLGAGGRGIGE